MAKKTIKATSFSWHFLPLLYLSNLPWLWRLERKCFFFKQDTNWILHLQASIPGGQVSFKRIPLKTLNDLYKKKNIQSEYCLFLFSRGMVVLGYSEIEISMKGSGYQFIHAADMMHCATNHMRSTFVTNSGFGKDTKHHIIILVQTFKLLDTRARSR